VGGRRIRDYGRIGRGADLVVAKRVSAGARNQHAAYRIGKQRAGCCVGREASAGTLGQPDDLVEGVAEAARQRELLGEVVSALGEDAVVIEAEFGARFRYRSEQQRVGAGDVLRPAAVQENSGAAAAESERTRKFEVAADHVGEL